MAKDIEYITKEINHVAGELTVRVSPLLPRVLGPESDGLEPYSYSNKYTVARSKASADLSLKNPLLLQIVLLMQTFHS